MRSPWSFSSQTVDVEATTLGGEDEVAIGEHRLSKLLADAEQLDHRPVDALSRYTPLAPLDPYVGAAITPPASSAGLPSTITGRPVCQTGCHVAGFNSRSEPAYGVPLMVVALPGSSRYCPVQMAAPKHDWTPLGVPAPTWKVHTGPAETSDVFIA